MMIRVDIWGEKFDLEVHQQSKSVWIARGDYRGESFEGRGRSPNQAAMSWRDRARYSCPGM